MLEKTLDTANGSVRYWVSSRVDGPFQLVFLPGLTADHRLFDKQIEHFKEHVTCLVWDPPSHGLSRPFALGWSMDDLARMLHEILQLEGFTRPVLVGQSMGGYVSQAYIDLHPGETAGFISIDSCPLQRSYYTSLELWALKHTRGIYAAFPWKLLVSIGSDGVATSEYGRALMREMMVSYDKREYVNLAAWGYRVLADAVEKIDRMSLIAPRCSSAASGMRQGLPNATTEHGKSTRGFPWNGLKALVTTPTPMRRNTSTLSSSGSLRN